MDKRFTAFLDLTAWSEGTSTHPLTVNNGYDIIVTGIHGLTPPFTNYSDHPFAHGGSVQFKLDPPEYSTAAGRYQLLARYWNVYRFQLHLASYEPANQDIVALQQMRERQAFQPLIMDNPAGAIEACSNIWASFPGKGNTYGQSVRPLAVLLAKYREFLGG